MMTFFRRAALASMFVFAGVCSQEAFARPSLVNGSFELPPAAPGGFVNGSIDGWSGPTGEVFWYGVTTQSVLPPLVDGIQAAFVNNFAGNGGVPSSNAICQQLTDVLQPNVAYTFSAFFGWRDDNAESTGSIELWAGGTVSQGVVTGGTLLASQSVKLTQGRFVQAKVIYLSPASSVHLGKKISVRLVGQPVANAFAQTNFDSAKLTRSTFTTCPGDLNGDRVADDSDFSIFAAGYDTLECPDAPANCTGDLNHDGLVDDADFPIFVASYDAYLCPNYDRSLQYVSQSRFVSASGCPTNFASAPTFGFFNQAVSGSCANQGTSTASQNSALGEFSISLLASIGGQLGQFGGLSAESACTVVFDVEYDRPFSLTYEGQNDSGKGAPTLIGSSGFHLQIVPTLGVPVTGTLPAGRYTLFVDVYGPGFFGGSAKLQLDSPSPW